MSVRAPKQVCHQWMKVTQDDLIALGMPGCKRTGMYVCHNCDSWTANLPPYRYEVCPAKDRRKGPTDRRANAPEPNPLKSSEER